ncbi:MAG: NUDIX hydrolase [Gemmatimonadaceae bacterium]
MTSRMADHPLLANAELRFLAQHVAAYDPRLAETDGEPRRAAVALVFRAREGGEAELLFIRRAEHDRDPWSGQMGLPGGRQEPNDSSLEETAIRETLEETGIDIRGDGYVIGALDELRPRTALLPAIIVRPYVAVVRPDVVLSLNAEVADALWIPLHVLRDAATQRDSIVHIRGEARTEPSFVVGTTVVWGMTNRILRSLLQLLS